ncbi:hypothetical protein LEP1GSC060_2162 [Leptospira weilii serovar Ranarum str. ICFT]|uniref:Uncharacterized protein n=1 Tax=Leptospira weilii serovar Ranarum str. ICFT TaxID=1218598 RepID=N1WES9_9LEPT|nr:hypothetical protein LEP1GSC060_2162 [Leptospira weilii serovar Ranarum str. ICFT]
MYKLSNEFITFRSSFVTRSMSLSNLVERIKQHYFAHSVVWIGWSGSGNERSVTLD